MPFPFDVHMMIYSDNAPELETLLHRALHGLRVNRVNLRREFFKTDIESLRRLVEEHHRVVEYVADAEALQYRQSQTMTDEDGAFIEQVFQSVNRHEFDDEAAATEAEE